MNNNPKKQDTGQIQTKLRFFDNAFHRVIICLERLELFLEVERLGGNKPNLKQTAMNTDRDLHDDVENTPSRERHLSELELQCMTLNVQSKSLIGEEEHDATIKYFYKDLLEWYGGRSEQMPYNEVESAIIPIMLVLNHQSNNKDFASVYEKYVAKTITIDDLSDDEKRQAVTEGMIAYIKGMDRVHDDIHRFLEQGDEEIKLTGHRRGEAVNGYKRIVDALTSLFDEVVPAKVFVHTISNYLPEVASQCPTITEDAIDALVESKHGKPKNEAPSQPAPIASVEHPLDEVSNEETLREYYIDPSLDRYVENDITYYKLHIPSPSITEEDLPSASNQNPDAKVFARNRKAKTLYWKHADDSCGGYLYIGDDANLLCGRCCKKLKISDCLFEQADADDGLVSFNSPDSNQHHGVSTTMLMVRLIKMVKTTGLSWVVRCFGNIENTNNN